VKDSCCQDSNRETDHESRKKTPGPSIKRTLDHGQIVLSKTRQIEASHEIDRKIDAFDQEEKYNQVHQINATTPYT
jgi:hypothetical protein